MSLRHAEIYQNKKGDGFSIIDLKSRNGTYLKLKKDAYFDIFEDLVLVFGLFEFTVTQVVANK